MSYSIDESNPDRQKELGAAFNGVTALFVKDNLRLPANGLRCLDLGCGIGESTRLLADCIGTENEFVGMDYDPGLIQKAQQFNSSKNISFAQGNASNLKFDDAMFDFTYARCLLLHLPNPAKTLSEMVRVTKRGGIVAVSDLDFGTLYYYPESFAHEQFMHLLSKLFADPFMGRKLWHLFIQVGYPSAEVRTYHMIETQSSIGKAAFADTIEAMESACLETGAIDKDTFVALCKELRRIQHTDEIFVSYPLFYNAWTVR